MLIVLCWHIYFQEIAVQPKIDVRRAPGGCIVLYFSVASKMCLTI